jgi:hypothetical protein
LDAVKKSPKKLLRKLLLAVVSIVLASALVALAICLIIPLDVFILGFMLREEDLMIFIFKFMLIGIVTNIIAILMYRIFRNLFHV